MPKNFTPFTLEDLKLSPEDAKLIADGAAVFMAPAHDPADDERYLEPGVDEPAP